jgi:cytochrome b561
MAVVTHSYLYASMAVLPLSSRIKDALSARSILFVGIEDYSVLIAST